MARAGGHGLEASRGGLTLSPAGEAGAHREGGFRGTTREMGRACAVGGESEAWRGFPSMGGPRGVRVPARG